MGLSTVKEGLAELDLPSVLMWGFVLVWWCGLLLWVVAGRGSLVRWVWWVRLVVGGIRGGCGVGLGCTGGAGPWPRARALGW